MDAMMDDLRSQGRFKENLELYKSGSGPVIRLNWQARDGGSSFLALH